MPNTKSNTNQHGNCELKDEEIVKALEGAISLAKMIKSKVWSLEIYKIENALDLINRKNAEIEEKATEIDILIRKKEALRDEIAELSAEVERLKGDLAFREKQLKNLVEEMAGD